MSSVYDSRLICSSKCMCPANLILMKHDILDKTYRMRPKIEDVSILDDQGNFDILLGEGLIPDEDVVAMYKHMVVCRHLDEIAFKLQRSGRMGTYPENRGQEVPSLAAAYVLQKKD